MKKLILMTLICFICMGAATVFAWAPPQDSALARNEHPRIWLTPERLTRIKQDARNNSVYYQRLQNSVNNYHSHRLQNVIKMGLMYHIMKDSDPVQANAYADSAMSIADGRIGSKYGDRGKSGDYMATVALVYDWFYHHPDMNSPVAEFGNMTRKEKYLQWLMFDDTSHDPTSFYYPSQYERAYHREGFKVNTGQSWHNYHIWGMANLFIMGAALYNEPGAVDAGAWIEESLDWYSRTKQGLMFNGAGGGSPEGDTYWQESICYLGRFLLAYESATGESIADEIPYYRERLTYELYNSTPKPTDTFSDPAALVFMDGDAHYRINATNHYGRMARWMLVALFPETEDAKRLQDYLLNGPVDKTYNYKCSGAELLWADVDRYTLGTGSFPTISYTDLPSSHVAPGTGRSYIRQNWSEEATHIGFQCGDHFEYHQHYNQGHFSMFKHSDLVVDSGKYDDTYGSHARNYYYRTIAHNTLLVYDPREGQGDVEGGGAWNDMRGSREGVNDGGQLVNSIYNEDGSLLEEGEESVFTVADWQAHSSIYDSGDTLNHKETEHYIYTRGDASKAYHDWKVDHFDRTLLYLNDLDALVMFDRVSTTQSAVNNKKRMLFHFQGEPMIQGGTSQKIHGLSNPNGGVWIYENADSLEMTNGEGKLFYQLLWPEQPNMAKIGGANASGEYDRADSFDFWVPADGNDLAQGGTNYYTNSPDDPDFGLWRIEVSPSTQQLNDLFLHVLYPRSSSTVSKPSTERLNATSGNMVGALLDAAQSPMIALFSKNSDGSPVSEVKYEAAYGSNISGRHIIAAIKSGSYDVYRDGAKIVTGITPSDENVLEFTATGGSTFEIKSSTSVSYDLNGDGAVNISDVIMCVNAVLDGTGADVTGDGVTNISDVIAIVNSVLGN